MRNDAAGWRSGLMLAGALVWLAGCQSPAPVTPPAPAEVPAAAAPQPIVPAPQPENQTAGPLLESRTEAYMDRMESGLRGLLRPTAIRVVRRANEITVVLPVGRLYAGTRFTEDGIQMLHALARALRFYNHTSVRVNGYTDTSGSFDAGVTRSQHYADGVYNALNRDDVSGARMQAHGFGPTELAVPTGDHVREPRNNRVELVIQPNP